MHEMQSMTKLSGIFSGEGNLGKGTSYAQRARPRADGESLLSPRIGWANGCELGFGISAHPHSIPLGNGGGLRCLPLCAFSVASPISAPHRINQNATTGRISRESAIRSWMGTEADRGGAGKGTRTTGSGTGQQQASGPHRNQRITYQRTDPHPTRVDPHPSPSAGGRPRKIPYLK